MVRAGLALRRLQGERDRPRARRGGLRRVSPDQDDRVPGVASSRATLSGLAALLLGACEAEPPRLRLVETPEPAGYDGLQYEVRGTGAPGSLLLWPQEGITIDGRFEPVRRSQIAERVTHPDGVISYALHGLSSESLAIDVEIVPSAERIELVYRVTNRGDSASFVTLAPCLQLPAELFEGLGGWARSKRVFVVTEHGLRWISDTRQTRGVGGADDPDPGTSPWAQHFRAMGSEPRSGAQARLALLGVARERVALDAIGFSRPRSELVILAIADSRIGVSYGLLNCLHAGLGARVPAGGSATLRSRIVVSRRALDELLRAEAPGAGERLVADAAFVPARARLRVLESFERGVPAGWSAPGGSVAPARPRSGGVRSPTDGTGQLELVLPPVVALESPELVLPAFPARPSWLSVDVSAPGLGPHPQVELTLVGPDGEHVASGHIATGKPRRFVLAVPEDWLGAPLVLRLALRDASAPTRLLVDTLAFHWLE